MTKTIFSISCAVWLVMNTLSAGLPQKHEYQKELREFMKGLSASDFSLSSTEFSDTQSLENKSEDEILRLHFGILCAQSKISWHLAPFFCDPKVFTLKVIEKDGGVTAFTDSAAMAWWTGFDFDGNPLLNSKAAKLRCLVVAMVGLICYDDVMEKNIFKRRNDMLCKQMNKWCYTYLKTRDILPQKARRAFEKGLLMYIDHMDHWGPTDINTNMDTPSPGVFAMVDQIFDNPAMHDRMIKLTRRFLFGSADKGPANSDGIMGMFHPAGYIGEKDGPETTYNGISLYYLTEAAMMTYHRKGWKEFMPEVIERMLKFKAYNCLPDPDGYLNGPSSWSKRTNNAYAYDQRGPYWRAFSTATISNHGHYHLRHTLFKKQIQVRQKHSAPFLGKDELKASIRYNLKRLINSIKTIEAKDPKGWKPTWPINRPYAYDFYVQGTHQKFKELVENKSPSLKLPFEKEQSFNRYFDGEFWIAKQKNWGFQVESIPDMGKGYDVDKQGRPAGALVGGSLTQFWTKATGSVIIGRLPNKFNYVTWDNIDTWTTHHLWGHDKDDVPYSSAREWRPKVYRDSLKNPTRVETRGFLYKGISESILTYRRVFKREENGLRIKSLVHPLVQTEMKELWENLPIFLKNEIRQAKVEPTSIHVKKASAWKLANAGEVHEQVQHLRLTRFGQHVHITFERPRRIKLAEKLWTGGYQSKDHILNLKVDLLEKHTENKLLSQVAQVEFLIHP